MVRRRSVLAGVAAGSTAAWGGARDAAAQGSAVTGIEWTAEELLDAPIPAGVTVTLTLDGQGRAYGSSGCNRFTGGAQLGDGTLRFGMMAGTRMACPEPQGSTEDRVHQALARVRLFTLDGSRSKLRLRDEAGATLMVLAR